MTVLLLGRDTLVLERFAAQIEALGYTARLFTDMTDLVEGAPPPHDLLAVFVTANAETSPLSEITQQLRAHPDVPAHVPLYLISDTTVEPRTLEKWRFTGQLPKDPPLHVLAELLNGLALFLYPTIQAHEQT